MSKKKINILSNWLKKRKQVLIGIGTIVIIFVMIYFVNFPNLIQKMITIGYWGLFLFIITYTIVFICRTYKLYLIFKGIDHKISYSTLYFSTGAGLIINDITPAKIGDLARIFIIKDQENLRLSDVVAGISIERILEFIFIFIISFFALIILYMSNYGVNNTKILLSNSIQFFLLIGVILIIAIFLILLLLIYKTKFILGIIERIMPKFADYIIIFITNFKEAMKKFKDERKKFLLTVLLGFTIWILDAFIVIIFFYLLGFQLNMFIIILATILINFSKIFPVTPGGWGISENIGALFIFFFNPGISYTDILSIFIIDHLLRSAYLLFYGGYSILHYNVRLKTIKVLKELNKSEN